MSKSGKQTPLALEPRNFNVGMYFSTSKTNIAVLFEGLNVERCHATLKLGVRGHGEGKNGSRIDGCFLEDPGYVRTLYTPFSFVFCP